MPACVSSWLASRSTLAAKAAVSATRSSRCSTAVRTIKPVPAVAPSARTAPAANTTRHRLARRGPAPVCPGEVPGSGAAVVDVSGLLFMLVHRGVARPAADRLVLSTRERLPPAEVASPDRLKREPHVCKGLPDGRPAP